MSDAFAPPMSNGSLTVISGLSGTNQNATQNVTNGGNQAGPVSATMNAVGGAASFNSNSGFDQGGAVTVGGVNPPSSTDYRTATASGDGGSGSCMNGPQKNNSIGAGPPPTPCLLGKASGNKPGAPPDDDCTHPGSGSQSPGS